MQNNSVRVFFIFLILRDKKNNHKMATYHFRIHTWSYPMCEKRNIGDAQVKFSFRFSLHTTHRCQTARCQIGHIAVMAPHYAVWRVLIDYVNVSIVKKNRHLLLLVTPDAVIFNFRETIFMFVAAHVRLYMD